LTEPTPLEAAPEALAGGRQLFLKREDVHELGAFKWRGALPALEAYKARGHDTVVTASTGNHGAATAWAAKRLGLSAIVYAPVAATRAKLQLIESLGAELRLAGETFDAAKDEAVAFAERSELPLFVDGAEPAQYDGYRAIASEILDQAPTPPAAVVVPVGNGALLGGIGMDILERSPATARVGVQSAGAPVMVESWQAGAIVECDRADTFADGLAARVAVPLAVNVLQRVASDMVLVSERELALAVGAFAAVGVRVEGSAAAGLAALVQLEDLDGPVVVVVTGRNIDDELWQRACDEPESFPAER
jgi:threonine dehydratase